MKNKDIITEAMTILRESVEGFEKFKKEADVALRFLKIIIKWKQGLKIDIILI